MDSSAKYRINTSLKRRLLVTGITLFALIIAASIALFLTAQKYGFYIERSSRAQHVYSSYRAVSDHTYRKLSALGQIVEEGTLLNLQERYRNKESLRNALRDVRENIAAELTHVGDVAEASELQHFNRIELLAEEIIRGSELVRAAVENRQPEEAGAALEKLRSPQIEGTFIRLIDDAISEELREVRETQIVAQELNTLLTRLLSLLFLCFICFGTFLLVTTWRALSKSLRSFESATDAFMAGDFTQRVPTNVESEFAGLAAALNQMASEVESQREREKTTQQNLESIIESRTSELKQTNEKLQLVSENRKQFLADISHELRTPLTIIQGEADLALRKDMETPEQFQDAFRRIKEQTVHTTRFVQDLLFVARAEDGKAPIHKRPSAIVPVILDICEDFSVLAAQKNIKIESNVPTHELIANIDTNHIKQLATILIDNALRYSYSDSTIEVNIRDMQEHLVFEVKDQGIGLKYNESSQVFSRFYRGSEGVGKASGVGLGLPVAKAIVDAHAGSIALTGDPEGGTRATVTLPLETRLRAV